MRTTDRRNVRGWHDEIIAISTSASSLSSSNTFLISSELRRDGNADAELAVKTNCSVADDAQDELMHAARLGRIEHQRMAAQSSIAARDRTDALQREDLVASGVREEEPPRMCLRA